MLDKQNNTYNTENLNFNIVLNFQNIINNTNLSVRGTSANLNILSAYGEHSNQGPVTFNQDFGAGKAISDSISKILKQFPNANVNIIPVKETIVNNKIGDSEKDIVSGIIKDIKEEFNEASTCSYNSISTHTKEIMFEILDKVQHSTIREPNIK